MTVKTREERGRIAVDIITKNIKNHVEQSGRTITESEARKQAQTIAERANRKRNK